MDPNDPVFGEQPLTDPLTSIQYMDLVHSCTFGLRDSKIPGTDSYDQHLAVRFIRRYITPGMDLQDRLLSDVHLNLSDVIHDPDVQVLAAMMKRVLYRYHAGDLRRMCDIQADAAAATTEGQEG